jgi:signal transduction histidine kinase
LPDTPELCEKERELLGLDHTEAAMQLMRQWNFEPALAEGMATHHAALQTLATPLARLIHLSNRLAECAPDDAAAIQAIAISMRFPARDAEQIIATTNNDVIEYASYLGMDFSSMEMHPLTPAAPPTAIQRQLNQQLSGTMQSAELRRFFQNSKTKDDLREAALKAASALFSINSAILLWQGETAGKYTIITLNDALKQLEKYPLVLPAHGRIAETQNRMTPSFIERLEDFPVTPEKNIAKLLGGKNWLLLPLSGYGQCVGMIFAGISPKHLEQLRADQYQILHFGEQFIFVYRQIEEVQQTIRDKVTKTEEKNRKKTMEMAHEINNPLAIIRNYLFILNKQLNEKSKAKQTIAILSEEINRLGSLIGEICTPDYFSRAQTQQTDIKPLVRDVIALFRETGFASDSIQIITHAHSMLPEKMLVRAPENLLKQILVNLLKNAVEAMPDSGSIMITYDGLSELESGHYYALSIRDTGTGIPEAILRNLSVGVTTKGKDHQGLGLNIVYSLLEKIEAKITCQSDARGTLFKLLLPIWNEEP